MRTPSLILLLAFILALLGLVEYALRVLPDDTNNSFGLSKVKRQEANKTVYVAWGSTPSVSSSTATITTV